VPWRPLPGSPALLLQHVAGTRGDLTLSAMDDAGAAAIDRQLGGLLARLHAVHPGPVGLLGPDLRVATPLSDADACPMPMPMPGSPGSSTAASPAAGVRQVWGRRSPRSPAACAP
jgi:hypothetical protein